MITPQFEMIKIHNHEKVAPEFLTVENKYDHTNKLELKECG